MNPQPKAEHMAMPKLMITKFGDIAFQDGRLLVEYDSTTDNEEELKQIVKAVNSFDALLSQTNTRRIELIGQLANAEGLEKQILTERLEFCEKAIREAK